MYDAVSSTTAPLESPYITRSMDSPGMRARHMGTPRSPEAYSRPVISHEPRVML